MNHTDRFRSELKDGRTREEALAALRRAGASPFDCIKAIHEVEGVGLVEAKRLFLASPTWNDVREFIESLADEAEVPGREMEPPATIYVALRNEGVTVWRPVAAVRVGENTYRIVSASTEHPDESWEFDEGDVVRCDDRTLSDTPVKVAVARAEETRH